MSSREAILAELEQMALPPVAMPVIEVEPSRDDLLNQYQEMLTKVGGIAIEVANKDEIQSYLDKQMAQHQQVLTLVAGTNGNRQLDAHSHDLHNVDLALINAELAVAENGAVFVRSSVTGHRVLPFIAENLAVVVSKNTIVANMHQATKQLELEAGQMGSFIAGPSKTADIEQALVIGAHGACSMTVLLLA